VTEQETQRNKAKTSRLAIAAVVLAIPALWVLCDILRPRVERVSARYLLIRDLTWLSAAIGLVLGIIAVLDMIRRRRAVKGWKFATTGIVMNALLVTSWFLGPTPYDLLRYPWGCGRNLRWLAKVWMVYANDDENGRFPPPEKWCDFLLESGHVAEQHFVCPKRLFFLPFLSEPVLIRPRPRRGRSHYALNPNAKPTSPPDTVLLFETKEGWNCSGGPAVLSTENHEGRGCNVAFVDIHVSFVSTEQLGELRWKPDDDK
jgi:hypothetical protein